MDPFWHLNMTHALSMWQVRRNVRVGSAFVYRQIGFHWRWRVGHVHSSVEFAVPKIHPVSSEYIVTTLQVVDIQTSFIPSGFLHVTDRSYSFPRTLAALALYKCYTFRECLHFVGHLLRCEGTDSYKSWAFSVPSPAWLPSGGSEAHRGREFSC